MGLVARLRIPNSNRLMAGTHQGTEKGFLCRIGTLNRLVLLFLVVSRWRLLTRSGGGGEYGR